MGRSATATETSGLRAFLNSPAGKAFSFILVLIMLGVAGFLIWKQMQPDEGVAMSRDHVFMDAKTMQPFQHELTTGDSIPVAAPSGGNTGYPAELCYWTKDGGIRKEPYPVMLNRWVGKSGETFCPDCGRRVVGHNPPPTPGAKPPPTESEFKARGGVRSERSQ